MGLGLGEVWAQTSPKPKIWNIVESKFQTLNPKPQIRNTVEPKP